MDCAVKRYEAYFCPSVPRKPGNETYGVQQEEISFLQAFFFSLTFTASLHGCYQAVSLTARLQELH